MALHDRLAERAAGGGAAGRAVAVLDGTRRLTVEELWDAVEAAAGALAGMGCEPGTRVALLLHNSVDLAVALYAVSRLGGVSVLLSSELEPAEIERGLAGTGVGMVLAERYTLRRLARSGRGLGEAALLSRTGSGRERFGVVRPAGSPAQRRAVGSHHAEQALIQSSSGTTGPPKAAIRTHKNVEHDLRSIVASFGYGPGDVLYVPVPLTHGYGLTMGLLAGIQAGATCRVERLFRTDAASGGWEALTPTVLVGTPGIYEMLLAHPDHPALRSGSIRTYLSSGSALKAETATRLWEEHGVQVVQVYGMMETSTIAAHLEWEAASVTSVGHPVQGVEVRLVERGREEVAVNQLGEVEVRSRAVSPGYLDRSGPLVDEDGWFATGDLGRRDAAGRIFLYRRRDEGSFDLVAA